MKPYFSHDADAGSDEKCIALKIAHGLAGYGLYWSLIERLRMAEGDYTCVVNYNLISYDLRCPSTLVKAVVEDFGLFAFTEDGERFYSESLMRRMQKKDEISANRSEAARKRWSAQGTHIQKKQCKSNAIASESTCKSNANASENLCYKSKVKESKVKNINKHISLKLDSRTREEKSVESNPSEEPPAFTPPLLPFDENSPVMDRVRDVVKAPEVVNAVQEFILERFKAGQNISEISIGHHLRDLLEITSDPVEQKRIAECAVKYGWKAFFPIPKDKNPGYGFREPARLCEKPTEGRIYDTKPIDPDFDPTQIEF